MANEISVTGSLSVYKPSIMTSAVGRSVNGLVFNMNGLYYVEGSINVAITETPIPLGQVVAPHWAFFRNLDATNFLTISNGASGTAFLKLFPGECAFVPLLDSSTPYALADTKAVQLEYVVFSL